MCDLYYVRHNMIRFAPYAMTTVYNIAFAYHAHWMQRVKIYNANHYYVGDVYRNVLSKHDCYNALYFFFFSECQLAIIIICAAAYIIVS